MAGPGARIVERVGVQVLPDTSKFMPSLEKYLSRVGKQLRVKIPTELDTDGIRADLERIKGIVERTTAKMPIEADPDGITRTVRNAEHAAQAAADRNPVKIPVEVDRDRAERVVADVVGKIKLPSLSLPPIGAVANVANLTAAASAIAAVGTAAVAAAPFIASLGMQLATMGIGFAALSPAAIVGVATSVGTLKVGLTGVSDALKNMGDAKKFAKDLEGLAPNARAAVLALKGLSPEWSKTQKAVQNDLFKGSDKGLKSLAKSILPQVSTGLRTNAQAFNLLATAAGPALKRIGGDGSIAKIMSNNAGAIRGLAAAISPFIEGLKSIALVATSYMPALGRAAGQVGKQFGNWMNRFADSGAMGDFIDLAIINVKSLGSVAASSGKIILGLFRGVAGQGADDPLGFLAKSLGKVSDIVNGPAFQKGLSEFFAGATTQSRGLIGAIGPVGDALKSLGPGVAELSKALVPVFTLAVTAIAGFIKRIAPAIGPYAKVLGVTLVAALKVVTPLIYGLANAFAAMMKFMTTGKVGNGIITAMSAISNAMDNTSSIAAGFKLYWQEFVGFLPRTWSNAWALLKTTASSALSGISRAAAVGWSALAAGVSSALSAIVELARTGLAKLGTWFSSGWTTMQTTATTAWSALVTTVSTKLAEIGTYLMGLPAQITTWLAALPSTLYTVGVNMVTNILYGLAAAVGALAGWFYNLVVNVPLWLAGITVALYNKGVAMIAQMIAGITVAAVNLTAWFVALPGRILTWIGNVSATLYAKGVSFISGLINGITARAAAVATWFQALPGRIQSWIGNVSATLYTKGYAFVTGLYNGIVAKMVSVSSWATSLPGKITGWIGATGHTLWNKGWDLVWGLTQGIANKMTSVSTWATGLAGKVKGWVGKTSNTLWSAGWDMIWGLMQGIKSKAADLPGLMRGLASTAVSSFRRAIDSHSPSRVFMAIGNDTGEGYIIGVKQTYHDVGKSAEGMASAAVRAASGARLSSTARLDMIGSRATATSLSRESVNALADAVAERPVNLDGMRMDRGLRAARAEGAWM